MAQSIEPNIADLANGWMKSYKLPYKLEQENINSEIDNALKDYESKGGGKGGNRPDAKVLLQDKNLNYYPILIEYKGEKGKLVKLDKENQVENITIKNEPNYKNISSFAVNGAIHYANALLHHTSYTDIIAIGMTGFKDAKGNIHHEIGVYFVSKDNLGVGQKVGEYSDFSFLAPENFDAFVEKVKLLSLTDDELEKLKDRREKEIDKSLQNLNHHIYQNEKGLGENDRVYLVAASIIATLGVAGKVPALEKADLKSSQEHGNTDGEIMVRKIESFLREKHIPTDKKDLIIRSLKNTLLASNLNKIENGETQLRRVFTKIIDDLGIYYKIGLTTDFTGKLFNEMYGWLGFSQDKLNDVVLTPAYISNLLVKLARVNKDSYVWDFATGSAGLLVSAMNEMLIDAKENITSPSELIEKQVHIKAKQLLGIELLPSVYMLAILNMIMMGDGSSNILNKDSLTDFDGKYGFGDTDKEFPASAFILNPPYSAEGNGMVFVETALNMMHKGYASIIIQNSAGSGKAKDFNLRILEKNTLIASIKMPVDIFIGKASVQTNIYVFKVNEKHHKDEMVKFIDFSNDGYTRTNRKKASNNLKDTDQAKERYQEIVDLVRFGKSKLKLFTDKEYYENTIDPKNGADWNQTAPIDTKPTLNDFKKTVSDYLSWEISTILKQQNENSNKLTSILDEKIEKVKWEKEFYLKDLFIIKRGKRLTVENRIKGGTPLITAGYENTGVAGFIGNIEQEIFPKDTITIDMFANSFYRNYSYSADDNILVLFEKEKIPAKAKKFIVSLINQVLCKKFDYSRQYRMGSFNETRIKLPTKNDKIDFNFMENFINDLETERIAKLDTYLIEKWSK
ncbi:N-6 DNA methylase [Tenacibaculum dicentrarchi]|nr:N-6 DNA methylase [Tenacibaculum dicentrarchi]